MLHFMKTQVEVKGIQFLLCIERECDCVYFSGTLSSASLSSDNS